MAGRVTIQAVLNELPQGTLSIPTVTIAPTISNLVQVLNVVLAEGDNLVAVPSWSVGVLIQPAAGNAVAMTLKGISGDTGTPLALTAPSLVSFPASPPADIDLYSATLAVTDTTVTFF